MSEHYEVSQKCENEIVKSIKYYFCGVSWKLKPYIAQKVKEEKGFGQRGNIC